MRTLLRTSFLAFTLPVFLAGCLSYKQVELQAVNDVQVERMDASGISARVNVTIHNPNGYRITVADPDVDLYLNSANIGKALLDSALVLDKRSSRTYTIPLHASFEGKGGSALIAIMGAALSGEAKLGAKGTVAARAFLVRKRFPFDLEHDLDLNDQGN